MTKKEKKKAKTSNQKIEKSQIGAQALFKEGLNAQKEHDYPTAIDLYSQALREDGIQLETEYEILDQQAECHERMGQFSEELNDLDQMVVKAQELGDIQKQMDIVYRQLFTAARMGKSTKVNEIAEATRVAGENSEDLSITAAVNLSIGYKHWFQEEKKAAQDYFEQALRMYRAVGDRQGEGNTLAALGSVILDSGNQTLAGKYSKDALAIWRSLGNRKKEASSLNAWGLTVSDYALKRDAGEEALEIFKAIGDRWGQCQMYNNLSLLYGHLGLYNTARDYARIAVEMVRPMGARYGLALYLDTLARAEMNLGHFSEAESIFKEGQEIAREIGSRSIEGFDLFGLGRVALMSGRAEEGRKAIQAALENLQETNIGSDIPSFLAWLGAAYLALDDPQTARRFTADAITELEAIGIGGSEYPPQEIWWWHYQALTYDLRKKDISDGKGEGIMEIPDNAWSALQRAREITLEGIATLSDEGLRRNYLNKVNNNREIISEWVYQAALREQDFGSGDTPLGNVQAQLQRQLAIGMRMNERREIRALTAFIMDVLIELSGAERAMLLLVNESGERQVAASYGFSKEGQGEFLTQASSIFDQVENSSVPVLREDADRADKMGTTAEYLHTLSILCVPLISRGKPSGFIYADNHAIFGQFTQADVDLLAAFANQVSAAIENAQLYQDLEQRVIKRTAELSASNEALEQRNAEFGIINSVQAGLASKLDFQEIIDLVGEKIREIFAIGNMGISILDHERNEIMMPYFVENGKRYPIDSFPFQENSGVIAHVLTTKQSLLVNENLEQVSNDLGSKHSMGDGESPMAESLLSVPILMGGEAIGSISLFDHQKNAFSESDLGLLTTLANSMSVALENARLFDQTNSLLEETQRRSAELAIINSVQEALASKLEFQSVIDFVGDKLQDVLGTENIEIRLIDTVSNLVRYPYMYERGKRFEFPPAPISGISKYLTESMEPLLINENLWERTNEVGSYTMPGTETAKSMLAVPFKIREGFIGAIIVEDYEKEGSFSESDLNLLTTLAASMSVALENARLFDETNHLLDETQQRSAELAIINSVQEALASKLEFQSVIDFVGDKLQEVLDSKDLEIRLIDKSENLVHYAYMYEHGERLSIEPVPISGLSKLMVDTMQPFVINEDIEKKLAEIGSGNIPGTDQAKSLVSVPFPIRNDSIGVIVVLNYEKEFAFSDSDLNLITTLAASMSVALENARLFDETNRLLEESEQRSAELAIINSVQEGLAEELDIPSIFELVGEKIREIFDAQVVMISTFDYQQKIRRFPYHIEKGVKTPINPIPFNQLTYELIEKRKPLVINQDMEARTKELGMGIAPGTEAPKSLIFVPMIVGDTVVGFVSLQNLDRENAYPESSVRLLTTLTGSMSVALENARLFDETNRLLGETQQRAAELATINTVGQALTSELEFDALIELIGEQVRQIFSADITYVALYDRQSNMIEFPYAVGEELESMQYGEGLTSKIIESAESLLINEDVNQRVDEIGATHTGVDVESYLGVPILVGKQAIGVISVQSMDREQHFDQDDVRLLSTIAANVGAAIRNAQLYQETQQRADEMAALTEIGREISATLDLENVLERIATRAQEVLNARTATIRLLEEDGSLPTVVALGKYAEKHRGTTIKMGEGITGNVAKTGKAEIINEPYQDERIVHIPGTPDEEEEFEAIIFAPLTIGERVIGVMGLWRDRPAAGPFTQADLNFLNNLARQAANAIENARLFEEVQREKLYSEALLQNSPVAIMTSDLDNKIVSWNPAAENLFGYSAEEAIGLYVYDLISNEKADEEISDNFNSIRGGGRVNTVTKRYRKDGSPVDVELLALPVVMEGKQVGLIAIYHDITELLKARHEAEAANEAKSAFLATMSHEIRTPMNGVIGMTSLLLETELDPEQMDYTETIRNSGEALLTVINDILDFSKIEAGKMELEEQPFDLRDCLESSLDLLKLSASEKGVELAYQMNPDVPPVIVGDITRLRQVLINLLNNGLKFTEQGEVVLSVSTEAVPIQADGPFTLHFSICDTGIGIPPDRLDRLFQAFSQVDASTSRKYGGTGLGLAISKRLSELMGGEMWVESVEGEGTTFHFTIAAPSGPEIKDRDDLRGEHPQLQGKRLLIVDDNLTNRRILTLQTRAWGMRPRDTSDPKEALNWVKRGDPFDLIILDYHMPGMDGIELSREIRKLTEVPQVLFSSISARESALEEGQFAAYLMKPLKPSVLLDTLMNLLADQVRQIEPEVEPHKVKLDAQIAENLPLRILLVEDNAVNQKLALRLLEQMGYRADLAGNGLEALQAIGRQKYDVVFMDVQMPEMDGLEASRRICARWPRGERPYIVAMTANAMQGDRERCLEAGMDDYVSKPIRVNELVAALKKAKPSEILE